MVKPMRAVVAVVVLIALAACVGGAGQGSLPQRYDLGSSPADAPASGQPARAPMVLAVSATALPLETAMIWRTEQSLAPQAYAQARWAAQKKAVPKAASIPPQKLELANPFERDLE